jgi:hypothetical protein
MNVNSVSSSTPAKHWGYGGSKHWGYGGSKHWGYGG